MMLPEFEHFPRRRRPDMDGLWLALLGMLLALLMLHGIKP